MSEQIKINVLYIPDRQADAERLREGFKRNGIGIRLVEVADDRSSTTHHGKIYYFKATRQDREFARRVAAEIAAIQQFEVELRNSGDSKVPTLAIWLAGQSNTETIIPPLKKTETISDLTVQMDEKHSTAQVSAAEDASRVCSRTLVKCPKCASQVRSDRLERHLHRHAYPRRRSRGFTLAPYTKWPWLSQSGISKSSRKCRYCGKEAIYGDAVCYQCQR